VVAKLTMIAIYLTSFWNVVVMNCIQPVNWKHCTKDPHIWLYPEIARGWKALQGDLCLYCEEKEKLNDSIQ